MPKNSKSKTRAKAKAPASKKSRQKENASSAWKNKTKLLKSKTLAPNGKATDSNGAKSAKNAVAKASDYAAPYSHTEAVLIGEPGPDSYSGNDPGAGSSFANYSTGAVKSTRDSRLEGKSKRAAIPLKEHGRWKLSDKRDPIEILEASNEGRIKELIPIRYGRMAHSAFAFYRGASALMAHDLSSLPASQVIGQCCGDCHLINFGAFATPERNLVLDINDFDETLPAPFEWDLKRLATSFVLAGLQNNFALTDCREAARAVAASYRKAMLEFELMPVLDVWYAKFEMFSLVVNSTDTAFAKRMDDLVKKAERQNAPAHFYPKLTTVLNGRRLIKDHKPLIYHSTELFPPEIVHLGIKHYRDSLPDDKKALLDKFTLSDVATKVVGVGSVGTLCGIALLVAKDDDALILQFKEARQSVLEPYTAKSAYATNGQRVVEGQRLMQAASDIFLGWTEGARGKHFYIRQLRDMKMAPRPETWNVKRLHRAAKTMGWILARAQARSGDSPQIAGYMGSSDKFDDAIADFAVKYAEQTESDYKTLLQAIDSGRIEAYFEQPT